MREMIDEAKKKALKALIDKLFAKEAEEDLAEDEMDSAEDEMGIEEDLLAEAEEEAPEAAPEEEEEDDLKADIASYMRRPSSAPVKGKTRTVFSQPMAQKAKKYGKMA